MDNKDLIHKSKFLSLVLRHKPEEIGIKLDENGWTDIVDLCKKSDIKWQELREIVEKNNKKRFEISNNGTKIRACQGHSVDVDLNLPPTTPPATLYHGTADKFLNSIEKRGLVSGNRTHVHLSSDYETAVKVGSRHGNPVVLTINSAAMARDGYEFYLSTNKVWLTKTVPIRYIAVDWTKQGG